MTDRFAILPLGEVVEIVGGGTPSKRNPKFYGGGIPWATVRDMNVDKLVKTERSITEAGLTASSSKVIPAGNIVIATRVGLGKVCRLMQDTAINQDLRGLLPKGNRPLDRKYLFYWYKSISDRVVAAGTGATVQGVKLPFVKSLPIPLPALEEQRRIVGFLDEAFEGLDRARANTESNLRDAEELFKYIENALILGWFDSSSETISEILSHESGKKACSESSLGPKFAGNRVVPRLPKGWAWSFPEQLCSHIVDCLHSTPKWSDDGEICLRTTNFRPGKLDLSEIRYVSHETYSQRIKRLEPKRGDVLYSREGGILGISCVFPRGLKACLGQRMMQFRLQQKIMLPEYFCSVLNSPLILREARYFTGGAAAPHLNISDIRRFPIPVPPIKQQRKINGLISQQRSYFNQAVDTYSFRIRKLESLRQSLLQRAFAGELA